MEPGCLNKNFFQGAVSRLGQLQKFQAGGAAAYFFHQTQGPKVKGVHLDYELGASSGVELKRALDAASSQAQVTQLSWTEESTPWQNDDSRSSGAGKTWTETSLGRSV